MDSKAHTLPTTLVKISFWSSLVQSVYLGFHQKETEPFPSKRARNPSGIQSLLSELVHDGNHSWSPLKVQDFFFFFFYRSKSILIARLCGARRVTMFSSFFSVCLSVCLMSSTIIPRNNDGYSVIGAISEYR